MKNLKRIFIYCIGLFVMAVGVTFSVKSNLGVSPVNSIPYVVSLITGVDLGICVSAVFFLYIGVQAYILKKDFKFHSFLQILCASLFGYFVSFSNAIFTFEAPENYILKFVLMLLSMILIGIGVFLYLQAKVIPMPPEGIMLAVHQKTKLEFHNIKIGFDCLVVIISCILSLIFLHDIEGTREGTILGAIFVGKIVGYVPVVFRKQAVMLKKFMR